jgi:deoxyribodipyrimidine photolyase-related protein
MTTLRLILGDQLSGSLSALSDIDLDCDTVLIAEVREEATYVRHHKKKIAFLFAAMRHFGERLAERGCRLRYVRLDDAGNSGSLTGEVARAVKELGITRLVATEPGEYRVLEMMRGWSGRFGIDVDIREDDRFLCTIGAFRFWAEGRRDLRMEYFYREMRRKHGILLEPDGKPAGGRWNFDAENRKAPIAGIAVPLRISHAKSPILRSVLALVAERFADNFGTLEPFHFAVTRRQALKELRHFVDHLLPRFGDWQDAMLKGEPYLFHSLLSTYLNAGLLLPLEVCRMAEDAYRSGAAPLNAVEGFIRQILGWREYVRGIYWLKMPDYAGLNALDAQEPLPWFYWSGETGMACIAEAVAHTRDHAYSHHIQRLMVTGNFALLAGLSPPAVSEWYLAVYSDAYEWVELPNTLGMALHGDGGLMASKPYAASGKYIDRMSDFCSGCRYDPQETTGETACPFNALYWDFIARHADRFRNHPRMAPIWRNWDRMSADRRDAIRLKAANTLDRMRNNAL